jgi:plasmid stabilization system protein ParE
LTSRKRQASKAAVELTQRALTDLREIERHSVETWGRKTADKYLNDIAAALDRLRESPEILRLEPDFAPGLFFYRVNRHFLVCDSQDATIVILTVIHTSMDLPARLAEREPRLIAESQFLQAKLHRMPGKD